MRKFKPKGTTTASSAIKASVSVQPKTTWHWVSDDKRNFSGNLVTAQLTEAICALERDCEENIGSHIRPGEDRDWEKAVVRLWILPHHQEVHSYRQHSDSSQQEHQLHTKSHPHNERRPKNAILTSNLVN